MSKSRLLPLSLLFLIFSFPVFAGQQITGNLSVSGNVGIGTTSNIPINNSLIISTGNVGIGTVNPQGLLQIVGGGNVGIGSVSPGQILDVQGTVRTTGFTLSTSPTNGYVLTSNASGVGAWSPSASSSQWTGTSPGPIYYTVGNVGIGSVNPGKLLDVYGTVRAIAFIGDGSALTNIPTVYSNPGTGSASEHFGVSSLAGGFGSASFGFGATAQGHQSNAFGFQAYAGQDSIAIGYQSVANALRSIVIGESTSGGNDSISLGYVSNSVASSIAIGSRASTTGANQFVAGSALIPMSDVYFGQGIGTTNPGAYAIHGTGSTLNGTVGGDIVIDGGISNQAADAGGSVILKTAPAGTGTTLAEIMRVSTNGNVGIGSISPGQKLDVQGTFRIANSGHIISVGTAPTVASNDCGTTAQGTVAAGSTDLKGALTAGTLTVTSCAMTFAGTFVAAPICITQDDTNILGVKTTTTTTKMTVTSTTSMSGDVINYHCFE